MIPTTAPTWLAAANLEALHRVNEQCLALLKDFATQSAPLPEQFGMVENLRKELAHMTPETRRRAAEHPFLLVDFHFRDLGWWRQVRSAPDRGQARRRELRGVRPRVIALARAAVTLAWHVCAASPDAAAVLLGSGYGLPALLRSFSLADLGCLAARHPQHLSARWCDRPMVWQRLIACAESGERSDLHSMRLYGLQLLGGDLLRDGR